MLNWSGHTIRTCTLLLSFWHSQMISNINAITHKTVSKVRLPLRKRRLVEICEGRANVSEEDERGWRGQIL